MWYVMMACLHESDFPRRVSFHMPRCLPSRKLSRDEQKKEVCSCHSEKADPAQLLRQIAKYHKQRLQLAQLAIVAPTHVLQLVAFFRAPHVISTIGTAGDRCGMQER